MAQPGIKELLEAGVHFGHQTRRWNPKMRRFLHGERDGIYIIDLLKTKRLLDQASEFAGTVAHRGGTVLFVGTKKQARDAVREVAEATGMPYVNHRWLGGLLTNFQTMSERIRRLHDLERYENEGQLALLPTRERLSAQADLAKLRANLGGVKHMKGTPSAIFVIDLKTEVIAVREAQRLRIPIIGLVDTNCDPDGIDFVIPGNDDAIRSCAVVTRAIGERVGEGADVYRTEQERLRAEAEERARREAEERARREAQEAEEAAKAAAAAQEAEAAAAARAAGAPPLAEGAPVAEAPTAITEAAPPAAVPVAAAAPAATAEPQDVAQTDPLGGEETVAPQPPPIAAEARQAEPGGAIEEPPSAPVSPGPTTEGEPPADTPPTTPAPPSEAAAGEQSPDSPTGEAAPAPENALAGDEQPADAPASTAAAPEKAPADADADADAKAERRPRRPRRLGRHKATEEPAAAPVEEPVTPEGQAKPAVSPEVPEGENAPDTPDIAITEQKSEPKTAAASTGAAETPAPGEVPGDGDGEAGGPGV